jgi:ATP/ADP translocase
VAGAKLVFRSTYLLPIVGLYELANTCIDYIFTVMSSQAFASRDAMAAYQGRVSFIASIGGLLTQLFAVSWIHRRLGLKAGLLVLPLTLLVGSLVFLFRMAKWVSGILLILYGVYLADRGFDLRFLSGVAVAARYFQQFGNPRPHGGVSVSAPLLGRWGSWV